MDNTGTAALSIVPEQRHLTGKDLHGSWLSVEAIIARQKKTAEIVETLMVEGEHFGKIEGCGDDKSLLKPGAELLAFVFGLAPEFVVKHVELGNGHREVIITCRMLHQATGTFLGSGLGSCSTMEKKYRWRGGGLKCPDCEFVGALLRSKKGKDEFFCWTRKDGCGATFTLDDSRITSQSASRIENPDIADVYNTVLKMAVKRAQVAATLTVCSCSNVLKQDLEDLSDEELAELADRRAREARKNAGKQNGPRDTKRDSGKQAPPATPREKTPEELEHEQNVKDWSADLAEAQNELDMRKIGERGRELSPRGGQAEAAFWRPFWERAHKLGVVESLRK